MGGAGRGWARVSALAAALALAGGAAAYWTLSEAGRADPDDARQVSRGAALYVRHCAACHGAKLEGQPEWRSRKPDGKLPAPPHDAAGHTWHHGDRQLFELTKYGVARVVGGNYLTDMPAYDGVLGDGEIRDVLAFIKAQWPDDIRRRQAEIDARAR